MKQIKALTVATVLIISGFSIQSFWVNDQVNNILLCLDDSIPGWVTPDGIKIILSWNCTDIRKINGLEKALNDLWNNNTHYKNMNVIILWQEHKKNHTLSMDTSPFTDWYLIKIDFNDKSGMSSTTNEYIYHSTDRILKETRHNI